MIKGTTVTLYVKTPTGTDSFNKVLYNETPITIENVLIGSPSAQEVTEILALTGRKCTYQLAIPKGDENDWENVTVEFFGEKWRTFGIPTQGMEELIPLKWNKKVMVERYE